MQNNMGSPVASTFTQLQHSAIFFSFSIAIMGCVTVRWTDIFVQLQQSTFSLKVATTMIMDDNYTFGSVD